MSVENGPRYQIFSPDGSSRIVGQVEFDKWAGPGDLANKLVRKERMEDQTKRPMTIEEIGEVVEKGGIAVCADEAAAMERARQIADYLGINVGFGWVEFSEAGKARYGVPGRWGIAIANEEFKMTEEEQRKKIVDENTVRATREIRDAARAMKREAIEERTATPEDLADLELVRVRANEPRRNFDDFMSELEAQRKMRDRRRYFVREGVKTFAVFVLGYVFGTVLVMNGVHF